MARITFILPFAPDRPFGGFKVAYEYANGLARLGHRVSVVHPWSNRPVRRPHHWRWYLHSVRTRDAAAPWFSFAPQVCLRIVPWLDGRFLLPADVVVLTEHRTASALQPRRRLKRFAQIVYDYEYWADGDPATRATIVSSMRRKDVLHVATSSAVAGMLDEMGVEHTVPVTAGLDSETFRQVASPESRFPVVGFAWRDERHKGLEDLIAALRIVRVRYPQASFLCFGRVGRVAPPDWITALGFVNEADLSSVYNRMTVFVLPSHREGWGLPAAEAMACGVPVVTTANGGTEDFAVDGQTALVVPTHRPDALAEAIGRLISDDALRSRLSSAGARRAAEMSWPVAIASFADALGLVSS